MLQKQGVVGLAGALAEVEHWMSLATRDWPCESVSCSGSPSSRSCKITHGHGLPHEGLYVLDELPDVGQLSTGRNE
jgi:hypothetical protein